MILSAKLIEGWGYTIAVDVERAQRLSAWSSYESIILAVARTAVVAQPWREPAISGHLTGCHRASAVLVLPPDIYDAFFNAPAGYRAQFARSLADGVAANARATSLFAPSVVAEFQRTLVPDATPEFVRASLWAGQAKIWIDEHEVDGQLSAPKPSISFEPWERNDPDGPGLRAPVGTRLEIKGGWINPSGAEVLNPAKVSRSLEIADKGFS